ncbi:hypothetical protein FOMPIDRAFT_91367 [Fomitopsis schrenkii]|uniref:Uncharacterized protein n=1 Tax=Fomitopsis schrenkii TaxID=2126942 RepID=S8E4W0_FOMSC|nr:hypothetical protein FOMPIDRAFT_91367 [Fomitopsis schrenkii]
MSPNPPTDSNYLGINWSDILFEAGSLETCPPHESARTHAQGEDVGDRRTDVMRPPSAVATRLLQTSGTWSEDEWFGNQTGSLPFPNVVDEHGYASVASSVLAPRGSAHIVDENMMTIRPHSEQGMPSLRDTLYWAIHTQCNTLGVRPPEGTLVFVVDILIRNSIDTALGPQLLRDALVPARAIEYAPPPDLPGRSFAGASANGSNGLRVVRCYLGDGCEMQFSVNETAAAINRHLRDRHGIDPSGMPLKCPWTEPSGRQCSTEVRASGMGKHLREVHIRAGEVICPDCGKTLARKDLEERHRKKCKARLTVH